jgi:hypothetical protein
LARIVVITHEYDQFLTRARFWQRRSGYYLLYNVLTAMARRGHSWRVAVGARAPAGDLAILHVDATFVAAEYLALAQQYQVAINFGAADISKKQVSGAALTRGMDWAGQVMVKSNLNFMGSPEAEHNKRALERGRAPPHPALAPPAGYVVLPSVDAVDAAAWDDPACVVERFVPELDEQGYALRTWVFMGAAERCSRHVSREKIVKAYNSISRTAVAVPDALRAERKRLGFDYGKFDFVMHKGVPVLLDANRTPGRPPATGAAARARAEFLADGLEQFLQNPRSTL